MRLEDGNVVLERPSEGFRTAERVALHYVHETWRKHGDLIDAFAAGDSSDFDHFPQTLTPEASRLVIRSTQKELKIPGEDVDSALRRIHAFIDLRLMEVLR
jgi:hypothetical protein